MFSTPAPPPPSNPPPTSEPKITRGHSCTVCFQRKVKCDGRRPCFACIKSRTECISKAPTIPRRRKAKAQASKEDLLQRLRKCEELLERNGLRVDDENEPGALMGMERAMEGRGERGQMEASPKMDESRTLESITADVGKLIIERGHSRYIENELWSELGDELKDSNELHQTSSDDYDEDRSTVPSALFASGDHLLFGHTKLDVRTSHPEPVQMFMLWQTFLDNVNPLVKLFHAPSVQQLILEASSSLDSVSSNTEALMFAIYLCAVTSLGDEDCERIMGQSRSMLIARFSNAAQQAFVNAEILKTSNLIVLQAFTLFLLAMREHYEAYSIWLLSGLAVRIGQRIGLHRESATEKVSVFEGEIRRRLWWQILILDFRSAQLSGTMVESNYNLFETKRPLNVNDSDLSPSMKEPPLEHPGVTDMLFCSIRYEVGDFWRRYRHLRLFGGGALQKVASASLAEKDKAIDEFEDLLEQRYLRYVDPSIPLHLLSSALAKGAVCQMRLVAHHPRQYLDKGASLPQAEKDTLFSTSLKMVEYDNLGHATESIRGYLWHVNVYLQLEAFIYLLSELRYRVEGEEVDRAWEQVRQLFKNHKEMITDVKNSLYFAIGNLTLKAWEKRSVALAARSHGFLDVAPPDFVTTLRLQRKAKSKIPGVSSSDITTSDSLDQDTFTSPPSQSDDFQSLDMVDDFDPAFLPTYTSLDSSPMDWEYWQALLQGSELPMLNANGRFQEGF